MASATPERSVIHTVQCSIKGTLGSISFAALSLVTVSQCLPAFRIGRWRARIMAKARKLLLAIATWPISLAYDNHFEASTAATRRGFIRNVGVASLVAPTATSAVTNVQSDYDGFASKYDKLDGGSLASVLGLEELRAKLIGRARGRTLEVLLAAMTYCWIIHGMYKTLELQLAASSTTTCYIMKSS